MEMLELMKARHSVRQYTEQKIEAEKRATLDALTAELNQEGGMHIQILYEEPKCFDSFMAHYGKFSGCRNYIAVVGPKGKDLDEKAGYYGEQLVLKAQELGLNTCWVAMTHGKSAAVIEKGEKLAILISLGYGATQGAVHKNKALTAVSDLTKDSPQWYQEGLEAALIAPTAMNQQKFQFSLENDQVSAKATGGFYSKIDLGIVKYHFEAVTGRKVQ